MKTFRNSEAKIIPSRTTVGLDVGDRHSQFCILDGAGEIVAEGRIRTTPEVLNEHFTRWARSRVVLEARTSSAWISRLARAAGHEVIVANPRELRKIHQSDRKNDRADAQVLARMARFDPQLLAPITHRSAAMQNDFAVVRARDVLVRARTQCVNAVRGLVKTAGGRLAACSTGTRQIARVKSYDDVVEEYEFHEEAKCADASGEPCGKQTVGLLQRRHVTIKWPPRFNRQRVK